jgi:uncharacterized membrane protein
VSGGGGGVVVGGGSYPGYGGWAGGGWGRGGGAAGGWDHGGGFGGLAGNGHLVAPTIARAALAPRRQPPSAAAVTAKPGYAPKWRNNSPKAQIKRQMRAHNHQVRARALRQQHDP